MLTELEFGLNPAYKFDALPKACVDVISELKSAQESRANLVPAVPRLVVEFKFVEG